MSGFDKRRPEQLFPAVDRLVGEVMSGNWQRAQAERIARRGLGPNRLARRPDPSLFNPMGLEAWTLPMVLAWLVWRTPTMVREWWGEYRCECWEWRTQFAREASADGKSFSAKRTFSTLEQLPLATVERLARDDLIKGLSEDAPAKLMTVEHAEKVLKDKLAAGLLEATAIQTGMGGRPVAVPTREWRDLKVRSDEFTGDYLVFSTNTDRPEYREITLSSSCVRDLWPIVNFASDVSDGPNPDEPTASPSPLVLIAEALVSRIVAPSEAAARPIKENPGAVFKTGAPGRPSSAYLVDAELSRRAESGSILPTLAEEAAWLAEWLATKHPEFPNMTEKTIKNRLRSRYRDFARSQKPEVEGPRLGP